MVFCTIFRRYRYIPILRPMLFGWLDHLLPHHTIGNLRNLASCLKVLLYLEKIHIQKLLEERPRQFGPDILIQHRQGLDHVSIPLD